MLKQQPDADPVRVGTIINMSSLNAILAIPAIAPYVIAKGVNRWTKCFGIRMANEGVRVNGICHGSINTDMFRSISDNPKKMHEVMSRTLCNARRA